MEDYEYLFHMALTSFSFIQTKLLITLYLQYYLKAHFLCYHKEFSCSDCGEIIYGKNARVILQFVIFAALNSEIKIKPLFRKNTIVMCMQLLTTICVNIVEKALK